MQLHSEAVILNSNLRASLKNVQIQENDAGDAVGEHFCRYAL
jgi:hypothetical protein